MTTKRPATVGSLVSALLPWIDRLLPNADRAARFKQASKTRSARTSER
jgi:hypothetical protein